MGNPLEPESSVVERAVMRQRRQDLAFLHWRVDPGEVRRRLPPTLEADLFDGSGWVGLVPFRMVGIGPARGPSVPYLGTFWESNVRTYVVGPGGDRGVWFDSLDTDRAVPAAVANAAYGLPYRWARMRGGRCGDGAVYRMRRRWPHPTRPHSNVEIRIGDPIDPDAVSPLEAFLTRRWRFFARRGRRVVGADVGHGPWPLHHAEVIHLDDGLVADAGYTVAGPPESVLFSPGVDVAARRPSGLG